MLKSPLRVYVSMFSSVVVWSTPRTVTDCTHSAQWQWAPAVIALQHSCKPTAEGRGLLGRWARLVLFSSWHAETVTPLQGGGECGISGNVGDQLRRCGSFCWRLSTLLSFSVGFTVTSLRFAAHNRGALWFMSLHENSIIALQLRCELCHKS